MPSGRNVRLKVKVKKPKKGKVRFVSFKIDKRKAVKDKRSPYTLKRKASGFKSGTHKVRVKIAYRKGKRKFSVTVKGTFKVC